VRRGEEWEGAERVKADRRRRIIIIHHDHARHSRQTAPTPLVVAAAGRGERDGQEAVALEASSGSCLITAVAGEIASGTGCSQPCSSCASRRPWRGVVSGA
jgi:hypothetical protein